MAVSQTHYISVLAGTKFYCGNGCRYPTRVAVSTSAPAFAGKE
jgi:hypothetical protein